MRKGLFVLVAAAALPSWASQPGQPLDCSDMVFLLPGYRCTVFAPISSTLLPESLFLDRVGNQPIDNEGHLWAASGGGLDFHLYRFDGTAEEMVGYITLREASGGREDVI